MVIIVTRNIVMLADDLTDPATVVIFSHLDTVKFFRDLSVK